MTINLRVCNILSDKIVILFIVLNGNIEGTSVEFIIIYYFYLIIPTLNNRLNIKYNSKRW